MKEKTTLFLGNDEYLVATHAKAYVESLCPKEERELSLEVIDGRVNKIDEACQALEQCIAGYKTISLFGGRKTVWLRDAEFLGSPVIIKNEKMRTLLSDIASDLKDGLPPEHTLVISASSIDRRTSFYKALKESADIREYGLPERDYEARPIALKRTVDYVREAGVSVEQHIADIFVDKVGFSTRQLICELDKLLLFKGREGQIGAQDIDAVVSASGEAIVWDFTDAVAERRLEDAICIFRRLVFQKESPIRLIIALEGLFYDLLSFREYAEVNWIRIENRRAQWTKQKDAEEYFSRLSADPRKMHWFRATKLLSQALKHSPKRLEACCRLTLQTHEKMISIGTISHELMIEVLLARLCGGSAKKRVA